MQCTTPNVAVLAAAPDPAAAKTLLKTLDDAEQLAHKVYLQVQQFAALSPCCWVLVPALCQARLLAVCVLSVLRACSAQAPHCMLMHDIQM